MIARNSCFKFRQVDETNHNIVIGRGKFMRVIFAPENVYIVLVIATYCGDISLILFPGPVMHTVLSTLADDIMNKNGSG